MRVLIACEYSGRVREAFRARGHDVTSCDFEPAEDNSPHHYQGDVFDLLKTEQFDLMIAHPPCTFLTNAGARWLYQGGKKRVNGSHGINVDQARYQAMQEAAGFFNELRQSGVPKIAIENPIMHYDAKQRCGQQDQTVQPWWFGEEAFKATCLWLKDLPPLVATNKLTPPKPGTPEHKRWSAIHRASPGPDRWKIRSRTFTGIANAMAEQWG
jgi:hypothetical protein